MKKGLINEAKRLQELAGITPINSITEKASDTSQSVTFSLADIEIDGVVYDEIAGSMEVRADYEDSEYDGGYLVSQGGWNVVDYTVTRIEGAFEKGNDQPIEDPEFLKSLIPKITASEEANKQLNAATEGIEFDSDFGQDPDAWHDRDN